MQDCDSAPAQPQPMILGLQSFQHTIIDLEYTKAHTSGSQHSTWRIHRIRWNPDLALLASSICTEMLQCLASTRGLYVRILRGNYPLHGRRVARHRNNTVSCESPPSTMHFSEKSARGTHHTFATPVRSRQEPLFED